MNIKLPFYHPQVLTSPACYVQPQTPLPPYLLFCLQTQLNPLISAYGSTHYATVPEGDQMRSVLKVINADVQVDVPAIQGLVNLILAERPTFCQLFRPADLPFPVDWTRALLPFVPIPSMFQPRLLDDLTLGLTLTEVDNYLTIYQLIHDRTVNFLRQLWETGTVVLSPEVGRKYGLTPVSLTSDWLEFQQMPSYDLRYDVSPTVGSTIFQSPHFRAPYPSNVLRQLHSPSPRFLLSAEEPLVRRAGQLPRLVVEVPVPQPLPVSEKPVITTQRWKINRPPDDLVIDGLASILSGYLVARNSQPQVVGSQFPSIGLDTVCVPINVEKDETGFTLIFRSDLEMGSPRLEWVGYRLLSSDGLIFDLVGQEEVTVLDDLMVVPIDSTYNVEWYRGQMEAMSALGYEAMAFDGKEDRLRQLSYNWDFTVIRMIPGGVIIQRRPTVPIVDFKSWVRWTVERWDTELPQIELPNDRDYLPRYEELVRATGMKGNVEKWDNGVLKVGLESAGQYQELVK